MSGPSAEERLTRIREGIKSGAGLGLDEPAAKRLERALAAAERARDRATEFAEKCGTELAERNFKEHDAETELREARAEAGRLREALDHVIGGYEDLVYLVGRGIDLDEFDHPLHQERKDSRIDEAIEEGRAALEGRDG